MAGRMQGPYWPRVLLGQRWRSPGHLPFALALTVLLIIVGGRAQAQEFSRYLRCEGALSVEGKPAAANADFAMRFNNQTALIQRSNILPIGERLNYTASPFAYSMTYTLPAQGTQVLVVPGWFANTILIRYADLKKLNKIRLSIDRQSGALDGQMLNEEDQQLASFSMHCTAVSEQDVGAPKL
jgi:hypothetical protein